MNVEKSQIKAIVAEGIGSDIENDLERIAIKVHKLLGAHDALSQAAKIVSDMSGKIRDDFMNGNIKVESDDNLAIAKLIVSKIQEVVARLLELSKAAETSAIKADGERAGMEFVVKKVKKIFDEEVNKIKAFEAAVASGQIVMEEGTPVQVDGARVPGVHPGLPIKMKRRLEAEAETKVDDCKPGLQVEETPKKIIRRKKVKKDDRNS